MKHVLIINHNAGSVHHGPNFRSYYVARSLIAQGYRVTIAGSSFSHKLTKLPKVTGIYKEEDVDGVRMIWLKTPQFHSNFQRLWNYFCFARRLACLYEIISEPVDAVICSSPPPFWIWFCKKFARKHGARLIFEARDLWPDVILEMQRTAYLNPAVWLMILAERVAYRSSDAVVAVNEEVQTTMERRGLLPGKFHAIPNGVTIDPSGKREKLSPEVKALLPQDGSFCVGYAGHLNNVYGLKYLIEAARLLQNEKIYFVIAASGGKHERILRRQAADLTNVLFTGWVPKIELYDFLRHMDIAYAGLLDMPSLAIGSDSTKIFEYMKAQLPIVHAIKAEGSVVKQSECGLVVLPENAKAISNAILHLRNISKAEREQMGTKGYDYLLKNRTYDVLGRKWLEMLKILLD